MTRENDRVDFPEIRIYMVDPMWNYVDHGGNRSGPSCSKLMTSLVNVSLKFQTLISDICQYFC